MDGYRARIPLILAVVWLLPAALDKYGDGVSNCRRFHEILLMTIPNIGGVPWGPLRKSGVGQLRVASLQRFASTIPRATSPWLRGRKMLEQWPKAAL